MQIRVARSSSLETGGFLCLLWELVHVCEVRAAMTSPNVTSHCTVTHGALAMAGELWLKNHRVHHDG